MSLRNKSLCSIFVLLFALFIVVNGAEAHYYWLESKINGDVLEAQIGYSDNFGEPEAIAEDRLHMFAEPLQVISSEGAVELKKDGPNNYDYKGKMPNTKGSVMLVGKYKPTFWSKDADNKWEQKSKAERPEAVFAGEYSMYAKQILSVGDDDFILKPVGQRLEIIPLADPSKLKAGDKFPIQVLLDGKPAKTISVTASFAGFSDKDREYVAFSGKTDLQGKINIIPLKDGFWFIHTTATIPHEDKAVADEVGINATLTFNVAK